MRSEGRGHIEHQRDAAGEQIRNGLIASALIRDRQDLGARFVVEQLGCHVTRGCKAGGTECQAFGLALGQRDQLFQTVGRDRWMRHQHVGNHAEQSDRRKVLTEIEARLRLRWIKRVGDRRHEKRVSIGSGARHGFSGNHAAVTRPIFDHDRLTETDLHLLANKPGKDIRGRAGPESDDDLDRLRGIALRHERGRARGRDDRYAHAKRGHLEVAPEHRPPITRSLRSIRIWLCRRLRMPVPQLGRFLASGSTRGKFYFNTAGGRSHNAVRSSTPRTRRSKNQ